MVETSHSSGFWPSLYEPFARAGTRLSEWLSPASEASSDKSAYRISVELPGVAEADVTLDVHDGVMTLKGEKREEREEKGDTWYFSERRYGAFSRSFRLPPDADGDKAKAVLKDGVLSVSVPRTSAEAAKKKVKIDTA
jgi:HSP20 family protein